MAKLGDHPGFQAVQKHIADMQDLPMAQAGAVLASSSRKASPAKKKKNPRLNRVRGSKPSSSNGSPTTDVSGMFGDY
jgi:hypothetical protein